ncbi:sigma-54 dependent transcriptional regulator [soil metagenome]
MLLEGRTIGIVEDDLIMGESLVQSLSLEGCRVDWWTNGDDALRGLRASDPDLVVCDIRLPDMNGEDVYRRLAETSSIPPFLFVTAYGNIDQAVSLMRAGAGDYVTKPFQMDAFIERAQSLIKRHPIARNDSILGLSPGMREVEDSLRRIANLNSPLLITGETGSGKEICARFLHNISARSKEPFIAVNCAAIPADRMELELFGTKGTGGQGFHRGLAERARGGILFLDEISELPIRLQPKLLRLVDSREFHRVGGEQLIQFHGRIVCATNADLAEAIEHGRFRADLYFRINGFRIDVPPLRRRADDIPWLLDLFFETFRGERKTNLRGISSLVYELAHEHIWPGNVRELRNRMERAVAMAMGDWIMPADIFPDLESALHPMLVAFSTLAEARESAERRQIERALKQTDGQIHEAAKLLDISRTTLWEKMRRLYIPG